MRRLGLIIALLVGIPAVLLVTSAGASDSHTYKIELDNAFGLVNGSQVRVAGVTEGQVTDENIDPAKRAVVTVTLSGPLSQFRVDATCSSQPQSLIAEYFLDCQPGHSKKLLPDNGMVPVTQTRTTVQNDLVQATLREPYKERLALIINEFGTALAGNPDNLNAAIRRGAPALQALRGALAILASQNRTIRDLNVNSDEIISRLAARRNDVVRFIQNANRTATASAQRGTDLSRDFHLLPGFLAELRPTLARLGDLSQASTPVLANLNAASGQLNRLTTTLPRFNDASTPAIQTLGSAANIGKQAFTQGRDEIKALNDASVNAYTAADQIANFLVDLDNPARAVENDTRATTDTGRPQPTGYTGLEGLLNYVYYQTLAINNFDQIGHLLHVIVFEFQAGPCGMYNAASAVPDTAASSPPSMGGSTTTSAANRNRCVAWLGPTQPGINAGPHLPPYSGAVCPQGSSDLSICNPANPRNAPGIVRSNGTSGAGGPPVTAPTAPAAPGAPGGGGGNGLPQLPNAPNLPHVPKLPQLPTPPNLGNGLGGLLGIGGQNKNGPLGGVTGGGGGASNSNGGGAGATNDLLNFLFGA